ATPAATAAATFVTSLGAGAAGTTDAAVVAVESFAGSTAQPASVRLSAASMANEWANECATERASACANERTSERAAGRTGKCVRNIVMTSPRGWGVAIEGFLFVGM